VDDAAAIWPGESGALHPGRQIDLLGGKSAAVVLDDADIQAPAATLAAAECNVSGQVCSSLTRIVVPRSRHDELVEALAAAFGRTRRMPSRIANDTVYGLNASEFTQDVDRARSVPGQLRSGTVGDNSWRTAIGGFKQSGIGQVGGREVVQHYVETKTVILDEPPSGTNAAP
jgi:acyl-CoA reductase-like NAD-dependent aldehyde dehydrogenase